MSIIALLQQSVEPAFVPYVSENVTPSTIKSEPKNNSEKDRHVDQSLHFHLVKIIMKVKIISGTKAAKIFRVNFDDSSKGYTFMHMFLVVAVVVSLSLVSYKKVIIFCVSVILQQTGVATCKTGKFYPVLQ